MGNKNSKDHEELWRMKDEYYERFSGEFTQNRETGKFGNYSRGSLHKLDNSSRGPNFHDSYHSPQRLQRTKSQNIEQNRA